MKKNLIKTFILTTILIIIDLVSKYFFYNQNYLSKLDYISPVFNHWITRGIQINIYLVIIISILAIIIFIKLLHIKYISRITFSIFIAWTLGNLIDRIFLWWVRDFIAIWNFPVFNIADVLLNIWAIIILINEFNRKQIKLKSFNSNWNYNKKN